MNQNAQIDKKEEPSISIFQETLQLVDARQQFFSINHISNESQLLEKSSGPFLTISIRTLAEILPELAGYSFGESPIKTSLLDLYSVQFDKQNLKCVLPPPSEGQQSLHSTTTFEPQFNWLSKAIIDSTMLGLDQPQPQKAERNKTLPSWENIHQLLIFDVSRKIHLKAQTNAIDDYFKNNIERYKDVRIKKIRYLYYKGKPSILLTFSSDYASAFAYFNFSTERHSRETFGVNSQVFRVTQNRLKTMSSQQSVYLVFRNLPASQTKQGFVDFLKKRKLNPIWVQELVQIEGLKYTLCKVQYLQNAFEICTDFEINPPFKNVKVNLHPKSNKNWQPTSQSFSINSSY